MSARTALERALDWLAACEEAPRLEARVEGHEPVTCDAPYALALVATAWRSAASLRRAPPQLVDWLELACDADGMVRFFGPSSPVIRPDLDDTALVWAERRALTGWSPSKLVSEATANSRVPGGAYNTWPTDEDTRHVVEVDAVVNANVVAMLAADDHVDVDAHRYVSQALSAVGGSEPPICPYYPDLAMLVVCAKRAEALGAPAFTYPKPEMLDSDTLLGHIARSLLGDEEATKALVNGQDADGGWPWTPLFIGGEENVFPDGRRLKKPWYGARATSTALAVMALARYLGLPATPSAPCRGPLPARRAVAEPWESLLGPLGDGVTLVRQRGTSRAFPVLESISGHLKLDIAPCEDMERSFHAGTLWAIGYRGQRTPTAAEMAAMKHVVARMDATQKPPAALSGSMRLRCEATDASDLAEGLQALGPTAGLVHVRLPTDLHVPAALPHLSDALRLAGSGGPELRFEGLPFCALPWPEELVIPSPSGAERRALASECDPCIKAESCPGPAGGNLRPRTSDDAWEALSHAIEAWRSTWGYPRTENWAPMAAGLHELRDGSLKGVRWSVVLVADVTEGRVDPTFRLDAFHGHRDGCVVPGQPVLERLPGLADDVRQVLAPAAESCPIHPAFNDGPEGTHMGAYADTGHLTPVGAWTLLRRTLDAADIPFVASAPDNLSILGFAAGPGETGPVIDVYVTVPPSESPFGSPPEWVQQLAEGSPCVATLRLRNGQLTLRKWDVSWWRSGRDDQALMRALEVEDTERELLAKWIADPRFGLHPTTLGWRKTGRRIYLRVC